MRCNLLAIPIPMPQGFVSWCSICSKKLRNVELGVVFMSEYSGITVFLLRDETYNLMESLVISFADSARDSMKSAVNFYFYSMRIHVEQACGTIGKRWGIYKAGLDMYFLRMI